jgi:DMSO/TMAO reductase YedYZ molybdopterin-dependent catalytic subunit
MTYPPEKLTRRLLFQLGTAAAAWNGSPLIAQENEIDPRLRKAISQLEYLTPVDRGYLLDKGKAGVAALPEEKLREIGLVPQTWSLEVIPDPASDSSVELPLSRTAGNALDWKGLMNLADRHSVRFLHVCVCTNGNDPFHMTLWEGVPLREVIWLAKPKANIRRVYYQSYHAGSLPPFQASLPLGPILETPPGQPPIVLAYKMNGQVIPASHGGPVRVVVPGTYGSKSIKWVQRILLTNDYKANDSDAELNNDVESPMKTRARFVNPPKQVAPNEPLPVTGIAQVGISGLAKVQYCIQSQTQSAEAEWKDAVILPPPAMPAGTMGLDQWPLRFTIAHWAALLPGMPEGTYDLSCRTIDLNGIAQPMPRPFLRTGVTAIHHVTLLVGH